MFFYTVLNQISTFKIITTHLNTYRQVVISTTSFFDLAGYTVCVKSDSMILITSLAWCLLILPLDKDFGYTLETLVNILTCLGRGLNEHHFFELSIVGCYFFRYLSRQV